MRHHVRQQTLHVTVDSEALAFVLQPRLQDVNRTVFLPIIERVFDELSPADQHTLLARLEIDLGTISMSDLNDIGDRFERILREALRTALHRVERQPSAAGRMQPEQDAQIEAVEQYLVTGTLPIWASARTFSLEEWIAQLAAASPERLTDLLRRRRFDAPTLQRMTHQLGEESVRELLKHLDEPEDEHIHALYRTDRPAFLNLIRRLRDDPAAKHFLLRLDRAALEELVRQFASEHADQIAADVAGLALLPYFSRRSDVGLVLRHLWLMTADVQLQTRGRPYERQSFVLAVLTAFADSDGRGLDALLAAISGDAMFLAESESASPTGAPSLRSLVAEMAATRLPAPPVGPATETPALAPAQRLAARPLPAKPWSLFAQYDHADAVQYFARYGVLPYSASLLHPELTIADAVESLSDLPVSVLHAMLADLPPDARVQAWRRVVQHLPHEQLMRLIASWLEQTGRPAASIATLVSTGLMPAEDRPLAYAQFIVRLLDKPQAGPPTEPALEPAQISAQLALNSTAQADADADVSRWDAHRIKAFLSSRVRATPQAGAQQPTSLHLLLTLIDRDIHGARHFLEALRLAGVMPSTLVDDVPSESAVKALQTLLSPEVAVALTRFLDSLTALAPADGPTNANVYSAVAIVILDRRPESQRPEALIDTLLRQLADTSRATIRPDDSATMPPPGSPSIHREFPPDVERLARLLRPVEERATQERRDTFPPVGQELALEAHQDSSSPEREISVERPASSEKRTPPAWLTRLGGVSGFADLPPLPDDAQRHDLLDAIDTAPDVLHIALLERIGDETIRRHWALELSEPELARFVYLLEPRLHRPLMTAAELLFAAWLRVGSDRGPSATRRSELWSWMLDFLADTRTSERSLEGLVAHFFSVFGAGAAFDAPHRAQEVLGESPAPAVQPAIERLIEAAVAQASTAGSGALRTILERDRAALISSTDLTRSQAASDSDSTGARERSSVTRKEARGSDPAFRDVIPESGSSFRATPPDDLAGLSSSPASARSPDAGLPPERVPTARLRDHRIRPAFAMDEGAGAIAGAERIYIANAGLVLANPFLPHWFRALDFLESPEPGKTRLRADRLSRAVHLLQWLVDGNVAAPEPLLALNKLLCGAPLRTPVVRRIEPSEQELEICQQLLKSMLANWTSLSGTSVEGLQETFLQREGRLEAEPGGGWRLVVQRKTLDVLLDQVPWSISAVAHAWMPEAIFVTW